MGYTHGTHWDDEKIKSEIYKVMNALNITRMPSKTEIELVTGKTSLVSIIGHKGGLYKYAKKLNLEVKRSETQTGKGFEVIAIDMIVNKGYEVKRMTTKYPFDLLVNNNISVDVKAARSYINNGSRVHTVGINKKYSTCDIYIIFLLDKADEIERTLIIPGNELKLTSLNLGKDSKYNKYIDRWDLIERYDKFYKQLA